MKTQFRKRNIQTMTIVPKVSIRSIERISNETNSTCKWQRRPNPACQSGHFTTERYLPNGLSQSIVSEWEKARQCEESQFLEYRTSQSDNCNSFGRIACSSSRPKDANSLLVDKIQIRLPSVTTAHRCSRLRIACIRIMNGQ